MLSTYCQDCGGKNEYSVVKPNFCSSCGQPLAGNFGQARTKVKQAIKSQVEDVENYDEDGSDVFEVPDISELEYEIEVSNASRFTLGSIMPKQEQSESQPTTKKKRGRPRKNG